MDLFLRSLLCVLHEQWKEEEEEEEEELSLIHI